MIFKIFYLSLVLLYFWYIYYFSFKPLSPAGTSAAPDPPNLSRLEFVAPSNIQFQFQENGTTVWEHTLPPHSYWVHKADAKIIERDDCHTHKGPLKIPAKGLSLYKFVKKYPKFQNLIRFKENSAYTTLQGDVFYFECVDRRISSLGLCPSGSLFQNHHCVEVTACTGQPDATLLPYLTDAEKYIECRNGREFVKSCNEKDPAAHLFFFYHDQCVPKNDLIHRCQFYDTIVPIRVDSQTLFECRGKQPIYTNCEKGSRVFVNSHVCEPADCVGQPDGTRIPLRNRHQGPFYFSPGYLECLGGKVSRTVECPRKWDSRLTHGDDTTFLPLVFDGQQCTVPEFCTNVWSEDPDTIVPVHEFTKRVQNWEFSDLYDTAVGYRCEGVAKKSRKRKVLDPDRRIDPKRFKEEPACGRPSRPIPFLPVYGHPDQYYDCNQTKLVTCPADHYFDGYQCKQDPGAAATGVFRYQNIPLFQFDSLSESGWIPPWEAKAGTIKACHGADDEYLKMYDICSHKDCTPYAFLSMIPDLSLLLPPTTSRSRCTFNETERTLKKEPVSVDYTFWDQKVWPFQPIGLRPDLCKFGQTLDTGHFIWDQTVFATCDEDQPFVFCPVNFGQGIFHVNAGKGERNVYACEPPPSNVIRHTKTRDTHPKNPWAPYVTNQVKRILHPSWPNDIKFHVNRADKTEYTLPETGHAIPPGQRFILSVNGEVDLELRYHVTHPLNVAFQYEESTNQRASVYDVDSKKGFHVREESFKDWTLNLPRYRSQGFVSLFGDQYHP